MCWKYATLVVCLAPVLAQAADERTCTMRDAAMPAPWKQCWPSCAQS